MTSCITRLLVFQLLVVMLQACGGRDGDSHGGGNGAAVSPAGPVALPGMVSITDPGGMSAITPQRFRSSVGSGQTGLTLAWTFGDGAGSTAVEPEHTYAEPGSYEVTLTVRNSNWESVSTRRTVQVAGPQKPRSCAGPGASGWCWQLPRATGLGPEQVIRFGFADERSGWLVTARSVSKTVDGGKSWTASTGAIDANTSTTQFFDALHGWRKGSPTSWQYTADGGTSWTEGSAVQIPPSGDPVLWPLGGARALLAGGLIESSATPMSWLTTDGGRRWLPAPMQVLLVTTSSGGALTLHGTRTEPNGLVWGRSTDQGQSFVVQTAVARDKTLKSIGDAGRGVLWATVDKPVFREGQAPSTFAQELLRSTDDGRTWQASPLPDQVDAGTVVMRHDGLGLAGIQGQRNPSVKYVLRTVDGGRTWARWVNPAGLPESAFDVITYDRDQVWVRMTGGTWLVSQDFGSSWLAVPAVAPALSPVVAPLSSEFGNLRLAAQPRRALVMRDSDGRYEGYHLSADQGQTWARLPGPLASDAVDIRQVWFFDRLRGMAFGKGNGAYGVAYDTQDGGLRWTPRPELFDTGYTVVADAPAGALHFTSDGTGWLLGGGGVYRSTDLGRTWVLYTGLPDRNVLVEEARFLTGQFGWMFGRRSETVCSGMRPPFTCIELRYGLFTTEDGGFSWVRRSPETDGPDKHAVFATPSLGFRLTANGVLLRSTDGGRQWSTSPQSGFPQLQTGVSAKLHFIDANHGWIQEYGGPIQGNNRLWRTLDGGLTWQVATQFNSEYPDALLRFVDARHGWLTGPAGTLLATTDGGQTWNTQATGLTGGLPTLLFALDAQTAWLTNGTGLVAITTGGR